MIKRGALMGSILICAVCAAVKLTAAEQPYTFQNAGGEAGLFPHAAGIMGHGAAWGDVDGDGWADLYVGTFEGPTSKPNMLFRNKGGKFQLDEQPALRIATRATGMVFADLDNDGDLELYVGSMPAVKGTALGQRPGQALDGCSLFRNEGQGRFTNISAGNGACPPAFGGRSVAVLDFDGDGLLDLLVGEDPIPSYNGSPTKSSRLFRNLGGLRFADASREVGLPEGIPGLGVAASDVNRDGWPDFFLASNQGGNRLFLNDTKGHFREAPGSREVFAWPESIGDDMVCGVCFTDVNRDGLPDVVLGPHYFRPWLKPVAIRLYLHRGIKDGIPSFEDVTEKAGLKPLPLKAPHVELQDFNNDGWPDLYASLVKFAAGKPHPMIFRNLGVQQGLPKFHEDTLAVNDFPNAEERSIQDSGAFFQKTVPEGKVLYTAAGPSADYDNDGRIDLFLASWWPEAKSLLLKNQTSAPQGAARWLQVQVRGAGGVNRMGIGSRVNVYRAGKLGDASALLGCREIAAGYGYASGQVAMAHFGLGREPAVDLEVVLPHGKGKIVQRGVKADQRLTLQH